jgi:hypothetical protein
MQDELKQANRTAFRKADEKLRNQVLDLYGRKCNHCSYDSDARILQLDHVNGGGTIERKRLGHRGIRRKALKNPELYQLLCPNCNWIKKFDRGEKAQPLLVGN